MSLDIKSIQIKPKRETYGHVERRIGAGKSASRYEEATYDLQPTVNFHYLPTYNSKYELFDERKTAIKMADWYKFLDPRQFYYSSYVAARAKQQEGTVQSFKLIEKRNLADSIPSNLKEQILEFIIPLRHFEWGANMNNLQLVSESYGAAFASAAMFHAEDRLGIAQHITKIALVLGENETSILDQAKERWLNEASWQGLRKMVEDSFVVEDWFELHVLQNLVMDTFIHELFFNYFEREVGNNGGSTYCMMTGFISEWFEESRNWVDKTIQVAAAESEDNNAIVSGWIKKYIDVASDAVLLLANNLVPNPEDTVLEIREKLINRLEKNGIKNLKNLWKRAMSY